MLASKVRDWCYKDEGESWTWMWTDAESVSFNARLRVVADGGSVQVADDYIMVEGALSVMFSLVVATSFENCRNIGGDPASKCAAVQRRIAGQQYEALLAAHLADYRGLFRRVSIDLGQTPRHITELETYKRLECPDDDPELASLLFQYGRYLLIASSRPGCQPANLQGILE